MADYNVFLPILLKHEGGYVNNPNDPGGPTNMGVTIPTLAKFRGVDPSTLSAVDIQNLQQSEVALLYKPLYWDPMWLDQVLSQELATVMCDQAALFGVEVIIPRVQGLVGVATDGDMGPNTLSFINKLGSKNLAFQLIRSCSHRDIITGTSAPSLEQFILGWIDRLFSLLDYIDYGNPA